MAKKKNDYFEMMAYQARLCVEASELLEKALCNFSHDTISSINNEMHEIEHKADEQHHDILMKLSTEFITPIDQEDILRLVQLIDDIADALDEVILEFYMYDFNRIPHGADNMAKLVNRCVKALSLAISELKNFKKPEKLRAYLVDVNTVEGEGDVAFAEAIRYLFTNNTDAKTLIGGKAILESIENCCDLCETAADIIEQIVIKNT